MNSATDLVFTIFSYLFFALMLIMCIVAAIMISKLLKGTPRKLGMWGFIIVAIATLASILRSIYTDVSSYNDVNLALLELFDTLNAFVRLAGIGLLALALLSTVRNLKKLFSGAREDGSDVPSGTAYTSLPPHSQISAPGYGQPAAQSQPSAPGYGQPVPQSQPSAPGFGPPQPYVQQASSQPPQSGQQPWNQSAQGWDHPQQGQRSNQNWQG